MALDNVNVATTIEDSSIIAQVENTAEFQKLFDTLNITSDRVNSLTDSIELLEQIVGLPLSRLNTELNTSLVDAINKALDQRDLTSLIGDPEQLTTNDRRNVVAAINDLDERKISTDDISPFVLTLLSKTNGQEFAASIAPFSLSQVTGLQSALDAKADVAALSNKEDKNSKGAPNGYAPLGADGRVPSANLPPIAVADTYVANSEAEMLALNASKGDICIRNDNGKNYILQSEPANVVSNWVTLATPQSGITSVAGKTGPAVTLAVADITGLQALLDNKAALTHNHTFAQVPGLQSALDGKSATGHTHTMDQISGLTSALNNKFDKSGGLFLGPVTGQGGSFTTSSWAAPFRMGQGSVMQWTRNGRGSLSLGILGDNDNINFLKSTADDNSQPQIILGVLTNAGDFTATGNVTAYSDQRLKKNIETIDNPLDIVKGLRGVRYNRRDSDRAEIGVVAQEIEKILPEVVFQHKNGGTDYKSVAYGNIVGVLIEAVKALTAEVEELKSRV